jgi:hypothetical protein
VTALIAWPSFHLGDGAEVDNQVAAPAETRTPNLHRAKIAPRRVRMEEWRLGEEKIFQQKRRLDLTPTGLLMEGVYTHNFYY